MEGKKIVKHYTNGDVTVVWEASKCIHSGLCFKGLPEVFDPRKRPWVSMGGAETEDIIDQVNMCPSKALSIKEQENLNHLNKNEIMDDVKRAGDAPMAVELEAGKAYAWCACGRSKNQPFCDGSHSVTSITPTVFKVDKSGTYYACMCKNSGNKPYCDGSHKK